MRALAWWLVALYALAVGVALAFVSADSLVNLALVLTGLVVMLALVAIVGLVGDDPCAPRITSDFRAQDHGMVVGVGQRPGGPLVKTPAPTSSPAVVWSVDDLLDDIWRAA